MNLVWGQSQLKELLEAIKATTEKYSNPICPKLGLKSEQMTPIAMTVWIVLMQWLLVTHRLAKQ